MPSHNLATVIDPPDRPLAPDPTGPASRWADAAVVLLGIVMTMCACGYEFGHGDHNSYFLDAVHVAFPRLLANDWFTTRTLQYHSVFSWMTAMLMRLRIASPVFLVLYLSLVAVLHLGWLSIVRSVGGSRAAYVASVVLWLVFDAGRSLAMYHMLQDSELLAANVASVAMLVGFALWMRGYAGWAGLALGISGLFHLNYAVMDIASWFGLVGLLMLLRSRERQAVTDLMPTARSLGMGTALMLAGSLFNILHAMRAVLGQKHGMPFPDFLDVYVHFRHPHHYDPMSWTMGRWLMFAWTIVPSLAIAAMWVRRPASPAVHYARQQAVRIYAGLGTAVALGLVFAGVWYVSATLVQLSLSRFGVYLHLFGCMAGGLLLCDLIRMGWRARFVLLTVVGFAVMVWFLTVFARGYQELSSPESAREYLWRYLAANLGLSLMAFSPVVVLALDTLRRPPKWAYPAAAIALLALLGLKRNTWEGTFPHDDYGPPEKDAFAWVRDPRHTPEDAIFLVSPVDTNFCLEAQRAIVVAYKNPPQLSNELPEWRDRMQDVLGISSLKPLVGLPDQFAAMQKLYDSLTIPQLRAVAAKYNATYALLHHPVPDHTLGILVYASPDGVAYLYRIDSDSRARP